MNDIRKHKQRFIDEVHQIDSYVYYMQDNFYLRYKDLRHIDGIDQLDQLVRNYEFNCGSQSRQASNYRLLKKISKKIEELYQHYLLLSQNRSKVLVPHLTKRVKKLFDEGNFEAYMQTPYMSETDGLYCDYIRSQNAQQIKEEIDRCPGSDEYYSEYTVCDYQRALEILTAKAINEDIDEINYSLQKLEDFRIHFKLYDNKNPVNIYRQSFIALMASFDATVFDIVQEIFTDDFFACMPILNGKGKIEISSLPEYGDFKTMKKRETENCLNKKYVGEILGVLHTYKSTFFISDGEDQLDDILEMVSRRNIHIHSQGIVDQKYFERGNGASKYAFKVGQYAAIDSNYYFHVSESLVKFINNLA